ncbi:hypothetical protein GX441_04335 [bacterium]|nr:hypothetical protein [bacterium]
MSQLSLLVLTLWQGVLAGPFRIADAESHHHQISLQAAMARDGRFAIAWLDSLQFPDHFQMDLYIRFFDKGGNPLTDAYKIPKLLDTIWVNRYSLDMDSAGNAVLVWIEGMTLSNTKLSKLRFMSFLPDGTPLVSSKSLYMDIDLGLPLSVSLSNNGKFAMSFETRLAGGAGIWLQRFDLQGNPLDSAFLAYDTLPDYFEGDYERAKVSLNEEGDIVVTWLHFIKTAHMYPYYQVFDSLDKPLDWAPFGHRLDDGESLAGASRPHPYWLDNDRFAVFWIDNTHVGTGGNPVLYGRIFSDRGQTPQKLCVVSWGDSIHVTPDDPLDPFSDDFSAQGKFAHTHERMYTFLNMDTTPWESHSWSHSSGFLGEVVNDNEIWRKTSLFEYTPAWGPDTVWCVGFWGDRSRLQKPSVACNDERIAWAYARLNQDTVFEAYAIVSDWDMGVGVGEPTTLPPSHVTHIEIANPIGSSITLRYSNCPNGFSASVFDASGRKIDMIESSGESGTLSWGSGHGPGVYFIVPQVEKASPSKVVLVK